MDAWGEQGAESLNASFNNAERAYNNMVNRVERLRAVLQNLHLKLLPSIRSLEPPPETFNATSFIKVVCSRYLNSELCISLQKNVNSLFLL